MPSNLLASVVEQLRRSGRVVRGEIGVTVQTLTAELAEGWKLARNWGVVIADVEPEGSGERAGLEVGDIVSSLNGKVIESAHPVQRDGLPARRSVKTCNWSCCAASSN